MKVIVDKQLHDLADLIDSKYQVIELDMVQLKRELDDIELVIEAVYVKCVDNGVELVVAEALICDGLEDLGIRVIRK